MLLNGVWEIFFGFSLFRMKTDAAKKPMRLLLAPA